MISGWIWSCPRVMICSLLAAEQEKISVGTELADIAGGDECRAQRRCAHFRPRRTGNQRRRQHAGPVNQDFPVIPWEPRVWMPSSSLPTEP